jgi:hypothetical protein
MEHEPGSLLRCPGVPISARTTGEVLAEASRILDVRFEPHDGAIWFRVYGIPDYGDRYMLADISVSRNGETIYPMRPKRDTTFAIQQSDTVSVFVITD